MRLSLSLSASLSSKLLGTTLATRPKEILFYFILAASDQTQINSEGLTPGMLRSGHRESKSNNFVHHETVMSSLN